MFGALTVLTLFLVSEASCEARCNELLGGAGVASAPKAKEDICAYTVACRVLGVGTPTAGGPSDGKASA